MKSQGYKAKNLKYVSMDNLGLAASLIYKGCNPIGKACIEGEHYFIFDENNALITVFATYGYEDEALVQGSKFYAIIENLMQEAVDESL